MFPLFALLKIHLAEEEAYLRIDEHRGLTADVADMLAAAMALSGNAADPAPVSGERR